MGQVIRVSFGSKPRPHAAPHNPNWWLAAYLDAYARLFGEMAAALEDKRDGLPSDCEPPQGAA